MRRLILVATGVAILLALLAPAALAAGPVTTSGRLVLAVNGSIDVPADDRLDALVIIDGTARVSGFVETVVVAGGSATLTGATVESIVVVNGTVDLGPGTTVTGDVRTIDATVTRGDGAIVLGSTRDLNGELAALAVALIPLTILFVIGAGLATIAAAVAVALFAARQTRDLEGLISREPGPVLVTGILGSVLLPVISILLIVTVIGAPIGVGVLFLVLPAIAFLAWIVAAVWIGDWFVERMRGSREPERPVLAAVLGVVILAVAGILPFVGAIATLFGFGAILLATWRMLRGTPSARAAGTVMPAPVAG